MSTSLEEFLHHQNVARYERLLTELKDPAQRKFILEVLAAEAAKAKAEGWVRRLR